MDKLDGPLEVMVTHPYADHIGGLIAVLESFDEFTGKNQKISNGKLCIEKMKP